MPPLWNGQAPLIHNRCAVDDSSLDKSLDSQLLLVSIAVYTYVDYMYPGEWRVHEARSAAY